MSFNHGLHTGDILTNDELKAIFKCSPQGGMRRALKTNTLVIISNHVESIYDDRWFGDVFHYTGMGLIGAQSLEYSQNKTLAQSDSNRVAVYLMEVFAPQKYTFIGQVKLAAAPYQEAQPDSEDNVRQVWVFPLRLVEGQSVLLPEKVVTGKCELVEKKAQRLSDAVIRERVRYVKPTVGARQVVTDSYERNTYIAEYAKRRANGICQLCIQPAPFSDKNGRPYLETHHIIWLSQGGEDSVLNTVALCPNCHRKMHALDRVEDKDRLLENNQAI